MMTEPWIRYFRGQSLSSPKSHSFSIIHPASSDTQFSLSPGTPLKPAPLVPGTLLSHHVASDRKDTASPLLSTLCTDNRGESRIMMGTGWFYPCVLGSVVLRFPGAGIGWQVGWCVSEDLGIVSVGLLFVWLWMVGRLGCNLGRIVSVRFIKGKSELCQFLWCLL
jgi:hypothetical protein